MAASIHDRVWFLGKLPVSGLCTFGRVVEIITRPQASDGSAQSPILRVVVADKTSDCGYETLEDTADRFVVLERGKPERRPPQPRRR